MVSETLGIMVPPNKAVVGANAFAHSSGIHVDGFLKNPLTYEIMTPHSVGVPDSKLVLGKHSGRHALSLRCEQLGYQFERRELDEVYRRFVVLADRIKHVEDHHLLELVRETRYEAPRAAAAHVESIPSAIAVAVVSQAAAERAFQGADRSIELPLHATPDHHDQEDYLWGV